MATFQTKDMTDDPEHINLDDRVWASFGAGCGVPECNCSPGNWLSIMVGGVLTRIKFEEHEVEAIVRAASWKDRPFDFELYPDEEEL
jgi:hypothetical protein